MTTAERPLADLRRDQRTGHGTGRRPIGTPDPAFAHALSPAALDAPNPPEASP